MKTIPHGKLLGAIFDTLSRTLKEKENLQLSKRPRLADWGEYAAAAYKALDWGERQFLEDWGAVVKIQNQGTLEGSTVAQAVLSFMENRSEWTGLASDLHAKLEVEAEELSINIKKDKTWPKSPAWLWRRMREVLPLLTAMGIEASNSGNGKTGTQISLSRIPIGRGPGGGSKDASTTTATTTEDCAQESASKNGGSSGSNHGYSYHLLSRTSEEEGIDTGVPPSKTPPGCKLTTDATSTTTTTTGREGRPRPLTEEETWEIQKLISEGMAASVARDKVLGEEVEF